MAKIIFDGENAIVGRMGSLAAKELLKGNEVVIVNSEKAIISGNKKDILERISRLRKRGGTSRKGPKIPRLEDRLLKRMIRGMLPWDKPKGKEAFKRLRCFAGNKNNEKGGKLEFKLPDKYMTIKEIIELV